MPIGTSTLTVTVTESITLNGSQQGGTTTKTIADVNDLFKRIITCPTDEITLYTTHESNVAGATFDEDLVKYFRVTNHDGSNYVTLRITDANSDEFIYKLAAGESFIIWGHKTSMSAADGATAGAAGDMADILSVEAQAPTAACDLEIIVACSAS